jgi:chorismate-pyruvate lyase
VLRLGRHALGVLLFRLPDLQRSGFEWSQGWTWPHADHWTGHASAPSRPEPLARRCVFLREQAPLLLTEVFLDLPTGSPTAPTNQHANTP